MIKLFNFLIQHITLVFLITLSSHAQDYWEETSGPEGGKVQCLAVDKNGVIYAGFEAGEFGTNHGGRGFYKSTDSGNTWKNIGLNSNKDVESMTITESGIIYLWVRNAGIMKSTDNGLTWKRYGWGTLDFGIIKAFRNNFVVVALREGLYFSKDNGETWLASSITEKVQSIFIDHSDNLFVSLNPGKIYKTSDYGETWKNLSLEFDGGVVYSFAEYKDSLLFITAQSGIYYSINKNKIWIRLENSPPGIGILKSDSKGNLYGAAYNSGLYISTDIGKTWEKRISGLNTYYITDILNSSPNQIILGTYDDGLYSSTDYGLNWKSINTGIKSVSVTCFIRNNNFLYAGSEQGVIYRTYNRGVAWERVYCNDRQSLIQCFGKSNSGSLFYTNYSGIYKSTDDGSSWYKVSNLYGFSFANFVLLNTNSEYIFVACEANGIHYSRDDGETWSPLRNALREKWITAIAVNSKGVIFAATRNQILRTEDFGRTWEKVYQGINEVYSNCITIGNNDYIYTGFDWGGIMLSRDNGDTWHEAYPNIPPNRVNCITIDAMNRVYFGNWNGLVFQSADEGKNWTSINSGLIGGPILNLHCDDQGNIYAGPVGGSVYRNVNSTFIPTKVRLAWPPQIGYNIPLNAVLKWYSSPSSVFYRLQVSTNGQFDSIGIFYDQTLSDTASQVDSLKENTQYFWRVSASNEFGWSFWSMTHRFRTTSAVDGDNKENHEFTFELSQNYPNPFNPNTKIRYAIPLFGGEERGGLATLKVYDVLGNEVVTLVDEYKTAGTYEVEFTANNLPSGIYFYTLRAGDYHSSRKMLLLK